MAFRIMEYHVGQHRGETPVFGRKPYHIFRILFVCTGNICRSPAAEGVARQFIKQRGLAGRIEVDSAGIYDGHVGEQPDPRMIMAAARRGYDLSGLRARELETADFKRFDLIAALDKEHLDEMQEICPTSYRSRLKLLLDFAPETGMDGIPDPYFGGEQHFEYVLDLCEQCVEGLLQNLAHQLQPHYNMME
jgi:protein-tyrosine phosphatase